MNYQQLHTYITAVQATLNSMYATQAPDLHLQLLTQIKRLTDHQITLGTDPHQQPPGETSG